MIERIFKKYQAMVLADQKLELHAPNIDLLDVFCKHVPRRASPLIAPRVLEIGGGAGVDLDILKQRGYDAIGIDVHPPNIQYATNRGIPVIYMDMHDLHYPDETFDGILNIQTFEHALSAFIAAGEMARVLKYGGKALVDIPSPDDEAMWGKHHPSLLYPNQIKGLFKLFGCEVKKDLSTKHRTTIIFDKRMKL